MKLRHKKTGGVFDVAFHSSYKDGKIAIGVEVDADPKYPKCNFSDYESLKEFCENWEDYTPTEPIIKDEKVRKAVRAWAEVNDLCGATYSERPNGCAFIFEHADGDKTVICFRSTWLGLEKGKAYGITELCGEEEE